MPSHMLAELLDCNINFVSGYVAIVVINRPVIAESAIICFEPCMGSLVLLKNFGKKFLRKGTLVYALCVLDES